MQMGNTGVELPTFWLEDDRSPHQPQLPQSEDSVAFVWSGVVGSNFMQKLNDTAVTAQNEL